MKKTTNLFDTIASIKSNDKLERFISRAEEQVSVLLEKITQNKLELEKPALVYNTLYDRVSIVDDNGTYVVINGVLNVNRRDSESLPGFVNVILEPVETGSISNVLNDVRKTASVGLADAKKLCREGGCLKEGILLEEAEAIKSLLEKGGAKVKLA